MAEMVTYLDDIAKKITASDIAFLGSLIRAEQVNARGWRKTKWAIMDFYKTANLPENRSEIEVYMRENQIDMASLSDMGKETFLVVANLEKVPAPLQEVGESIVVFKEKVSMEAMAHEIMDKMFLLLRF